MTVIIGTTLTSFEIAPDGSTVSIHVADQDSRPGSLVLSADCLGPLMLSLPEMSQQVLQRRYRDDSLRLIYPVGNWRLEASTELSRLILTLSIGDGFTMAFALEPDQLACIADTARGHDQVAAPFLN
jgi:hypothetical protein